MAAIVPMARLPSIITQEVEAFNKMRLLRESSRIEKHTRKLADLSCDPPTSTESLPKIARPRHPKRTLASDDELFSR